MLDLFRILVVVFLLMHGLGHILWFLAAWTRINVGFGDGRWALPGDITIRSPIGRALGLLALVVLVMFVTAALGLLLKQPFWASWTQVAVFLSFGTVVPWLRQSPGSTALYAIAANIVLMFLLALDLSLDITA